ncbi:cell envelope integrity protein CreD [Sulfurospirillum cavolei]|uniref:cell envelope integrity protein CreD n=1 Tax=Sulfurospirillum cavolei TaxID=366522 RepID=UPI000764890F|nr:cell envelope integrity protein CreD [Sulfurospirillum cavolei]
MSVNSEKFGNFMRNSVSLKMISIAFLTLILLIPMSMISSTMNERENRKTTVVSETNHNWGDAQKITGPFFTVPFKVFLKDEKNNQTKYSIRYLHILPEDLNISGVIDPQMRYRNIYQTVVYNSQIDIKGNFVIPSLKHLDIDPSNILWDEAVFSIGISDMRGIQKNIIVSFNDKVYQAGPGLKTQDIGKSGAQAIIPISIDKKDQSFSLQLFLNGSEKLYFVPLGKTTHIEVKSSWKTPSFKGSFLPTVREITEKGFSAQWNVLHLNRSYPQVWIGDDYKIGSPIPNNHKNLYIAQESPDASFGVQLLIPADIYQKSIRVTKYAFMFIIFTFSAFFFSEVINKRRVHPIQYILIGLAILLFYVLLLAISEHFNFDIAYLVSAFLITVLVSGYSKSITKSTSFTKIVCSILITLYGYFYIVLQLEDYALIMGSIGLFGILTTIMYITRKIDWYSTNEADM